MADKNEPTRPHESFGGNREDARREGAARVLALQRTLTAQAARIRGLEGGDG